jgi:hypothetical protein
LNRGRADEAGRFAFARRVPVEGSGNGEIRYILWALLGQLAHARIVAEGEERVGAIPLPCVAAPCWRAPVRETAVFA